MLRVCLCRAGSAPVACARAVVPWSRVGCLCRSRASESAPRCVFVVLMLFLVLRDIELCASAARRVALGPLPWRGGAPRAPAALRHARAFPVVVTWLLACSVARRTRGNRGRSVLCAVAACGPVGASASPLPPTSRKWVIRTVNFWSYALLELEISRKSDAAACCLPQGLPTRSNIREVSITLYFFAVWAVSKVKVTGRRGGYSCVRMRKVK